MLNSQKFSLGLLIGSILLSVVANFIPLLIITLAQISLEDVMNNMQWILTLVAVFNYCVLGIFVFSTINLTRLIWKEEVTKSKSFLASKKTWIVTFIFASLVLMAYPIIYDFYLSLVLMYPGLIEESVQWLESPTIAIITYGIFLIGLVALINLARLISRRDKMTRLGSV